MRIIVLLSVLVLAGCAVNSGVIPLGQNAYGVSRQAASGFSNYRELKPEAINEANQYCAGQKQTAVLTSVKDARPTSGPGDFPKAEIQFTCVDPTKIDSILTECNQKRLRKEVSGYKGSVECSSPRVIAAWRERQYPYMDLINVYEAARLVGAENVDRGKISVAEYKFQLAELQSRLTAEDQRRNLAIANAQTAQAQAQATRNQASAAMLQGLSAFQMANRPQAINVNICRTMPGQIDTCSYPR
ncbi:MAG: hypothetical protein KGK01_02060 [Bradyrhizobium sp.]|uniref:hypothetical protein n=1 Tax=Bradyrhizobium sp. TaxID=376 RepID=UPI001C28CC9E|nr:hypothetical protein [Bradyrhizobium sp.]MBU6463592.1 hypothetical protein [Pseudomonadota bacterium]MDE2067022.1 hypothetical protein [Bradyrhizobium sp.]MDE2241248.1 hypothetical protein [Bradyrhizobium sp.]